jgi:ThiF family
MSRRPIDRSPDLKKLRDEGYDIAIRSGYLVMKDVPYLNANKEIKRGVLISKLELSNDKANPPQDHVAQFAGEFPCHKDGRAIEQIGSTAPSPLKIDDDLTANFSFSAKPKPKDNYDDYYAKMTTYVGILQGPAQFYDPNISAQTYPVIRAEPEESVFKYIDTASSRAEITAISQKLELGKIAIVGLGGTGSYVLDLVVKTPVKQIHLFDGDTFLQHNAFRSPGAASGEELDEKLTKVAYFERIYSKMRHGIVPHPEYIGPENVQLLQGMDFVFLCMEGPTKKPVVQKLEEFGIAFVDVGMGIYLVSEQLSLGGQLRTTLSTPQKRDHVWTKQRIPFSEVAEVNEYDKNIQIADLNALNGALAVIRWKKQFGFYLDQEHEHFSFYSIGGNEITNEDKS